MDSNYQKYNNIFKLEEEYFEILFSVLKIRLIKKSEYFLKQGECCNHFLFVKSGLLRSFHVNEAGNDISYNFHFNGAIFSEYESLLHSKKSTLSIQSIQDSELFTLHKEDLKKLYTIDPYWQIYGRKMKENLYLDSRKRIEDLLYRTPEIRYQNLVASSPHIFKFVAQKHIASYLGITPQSLSRIKKRIG